MTSEKDVKKTAREEILEELEKGMNNAGLGGVGSVKAGAVLPSFNTMTPKKNTNSSTPSVGLPQQSKKNPIKQAEQIQNKDIKDIKMKEAQQKLVLQKEEEQEVIKYDENGQWSLDKADGKKIIRRKPGEKTGLAPEERKQKENQAKVEEKLKDPEYKKKALMYNVGKEIKAKQQNENYDKAVKEFDPDQRPPVAQKKRSATFIQQFNRRKDAPDKKLINKENKVKKSIQELFEKLDRVKQELQELNKSNYKGYTEADNAKRKANNLSEDTGIKSMPRIKKYGGSGPSAISREVAESKKKSKKNPVKVYTKEEIDQINKDRHGKNS